MEVDVDIEDLVVPSWMSFFDRDSREGSGAACHSAFWKCRKIRCVEIREGQEEADPEGRRRMSWTSRLGYDNFRKTIRERADPSAVRTVNFHAEDDVDKRNEWVC